MVKQEKMNQTPKVELIAFQRGDVHLLWAWMQEFRQFNFDDSGPKSAVDLASSIDFWMDSGVNFFEVLAGNKPVGAIGLLVSGDQAQFRGICFSSSVHGTGIPAAAVMEVLESHFATGVKRVLASYFQDNRRVAKFLGKFGARVVGERVGGTLREGIRKWNWETVEITPHDFYAKRGARSADTDTPKNLLVHA